MRKALLVVSIVMLLVGQAFADVSHASVVSVRSIVVGTTEKNPNIMVGLETDSQFLSPGMETTSITGLNLTEDGSFSFVLMTSDQVVLSETARTMMDIEIVAEGFDLYDYDYTGVTDGSMSDASKVKVKNAVPLLSSSPEITIPTFYGNDQNVSVSRSGEKGNKISVMFNPGLTKEKLVLGTFTIEWKGKRPLDAGIYKAKVSITYSPN